MAWRGLPPLTPQLCFLRQMGSSSPASSSSTATRVASPSSGPAQPSALEVPSPACVDRARRRPSVMGALPTAVHPASATALRPAKTTRLGEFQCVEKLRFAASCRSKGLRCLSLPKRETEVCARGWDMGVCEGLDFARFCCVSISMIFNAQPSEGYLRVPHRMSFRL